MMVINGDLKEEVTDNTIESEEDQILSAEYGLYSIDAAMIEFRNTYQEGEAYV